MGDLTHALTRSASARLPATEKVSAPMRTSALAAYKIASGADGQKILDHF